MRACSRTFQLGSFSAQTPGAEPSAPLLDQRRSPAACPLDPPYERAATFSAQMEQFVITSTTEWIVGTGWLGKNCGLSTLGRNSTISRRRSSNGKLPLMTSPSPNLAPRRSHPHGGPWRGGLPRSASCGAVTTNTAPTCCIGTCGKLTASCSTSSTMTHSWPPCRFGSMQPPPPHASGTWSAGLAGHGCRRSWGEGRGHCHRGARQSLEGVGHTWAEGQKWRHPAHQTGFPVVTQPLRVG